MQAATASANSMPCDGATTPDSDRNLGEALARRCLDSVLGHIGEDDDAATVAGSDSKFVVLRSEDKAEEWHFDEASHAACVDAVKDKCRALKEREMHARELACHQQREADDHTKEVLARVEKQEQEHATELSNLRGELLETQESMEELLEDYRQQEAALEREIAAERRHRLGLEAELRDERKQPDAARKRIMEIENDTTVALREHDQRIREHRKEANREMTEIRNTTEEKVLQMLEKFREDRAALQQQLNEVLHETHKTVGAEIENRWEISKCADADVAVVDNQVRQGLSTTHRTVFDLQDDAHKQVRDIQAHDFALESLLQEHADAALTALMCATEEKHQAKMVEKEHKRRNNAAVKALGATFPRSTQYQLHPERKAKSTLMLSARAVVATQN